MNKSKKIINYFYEAKVNEEKETRWRFILAETKKSFSFFVFLTAFISGQDGG